MKENILSWLDATRRVFIRNRISPDHDMGFFPLLELILAIRGTSKDLLGRMGMEDPEVSSLSPRQDFIRIIIE